MKRIFYLILLLLCQYGLSAQTKDFPGKFKDGYALKGADTIRCKVQFNSNHDHAFKSVTLLVNDEEVTFFAGGPITGFGIEDDGKLYDYGTVDVEVSVANRRTANLLFIKKLAAGTIDLFEYSYSVVTTKRTTVNGVEKPGSSSSIRQNTTNHYIAKTDPAAPGLATPVLLTSFKKKDLESYMGDNPGLFSGSEKRFSLKELISIIKDYNTWRLGSKKNQ